MTNIKTHNSKDTHNNNYDHNFIVSYIRLARTKNIGPKTFFELLKLFSSPINAISHIQELGKRNKKFSLISIPSIGDILLEIERAEKFNAKIVLECYEEYPNVLRFFEDRPVVLTLLGNIELIKKQQIAVVGSRNGSASSNMFAEQIAREIGVQGYIITSGMAKGIDKAAHLGAMKTGTIAVMASGINNIYPKENEKLYHEISKEGLVVTEKAFGQEPVAKYFPQRNRIIAGLAIGVLVVEAAERSGSLITARIASEYGKEIFAVPGSPLDMRCRGNNLLLKQGATLVESAEDVIFSLKNNLQLDLMLDSQIEKRHQLDPIYEIPAEDALNKYRKKLISALSFVPIDIERLIEYTEIPYNIMLLLILEMELSGELERFYGNKVALIRIQDV